MDGHGGFPSPTSLYNQMAQLVECRDRALARLNDLHNSGMGKHDETRARVLAFYTETCASIAECSQRLCSGGTRLVRVVHPRTGAALSADLAVTLGAGAGSSADDARALHTLLTVLQRVYCTVEADWVEFAACVLGLDAHELDALGAFMRAPCEPDGAAFAVRLAHALAVSGDSGRAYGVCVLPIALMAAFVIDDESGPLQAQPTAQRAAQCAAHDELLDAGRASRLGVVLDLDETLVRSVDADSEAARRIQKQVDCGMLERIDTHSGLLTVTRPWARSLLALLAYHELDIYALTAASQDYCDSVVAHFNAGGAAIRAGVSCRRGACGPVLKCFSQLAKHGLRVERALALDNCPLAWASATRAQVVPVPDFDPSMTEGQAAHVLLVAFDMLLNYVNRQLEADLAAARQGMAAPPIRDTICAYETAKMQKHMLVRARTIAQAGLQSEPVNLA